MSLTCSGVNLREGREEASSIRGGGGGGQWERQMALGFISPNSTSWHHVHEASHATLD